MEALRITRMEDAIRETEAMFDASNLSGIAHSFVDLMKFLGTLSTSTGERNRHPLTVLWIEKMSELAGMTIDSQGSSEAWRNAYEWYKNAKTQYLTVQS